VSKKKSTQPFLFIFCGSQHKQIFIKINDYKLYPPFDLKKTVNFSTFVSMKQVQLTDFPSNHEKELEIRKWDEVDVVLFSGDAYVDHPSFAGAVVGRIIEHEGYRVALVPQPNWRDDLRDFKKLGRPRKFFAVTAGCMDSMVNHYTANKRLRSDDAYSPNGKAGFRPDRATVTYCKILKQLFPDFLS